MAFKTNTSKASESNFKLKPEGDYEVIISEATIAVTKNGKKNIQLVYVIRNDVSQDYQNGLIFHSIWKKSADYQNDDDRSIGGFNFAQLMAIVEAANLPDGKEYATLDDLLDELVGKALKVHLYHDDFNDKFYEKIDRHMLTDFPKVKHRDKAAATPRTTPKPQALPSQALSGGSIDNDDYPF